MAAKSPRTPKAAPAITRIAVIGAGTMGAGIAAQAANAGLPVLLLDIVPPGAADRSVLAKTAVAKLKKSNPAALMHPAAARLITPGNTEDDLAKLADADWIIEAVVERLDIKQALYKKLAKVCKPGALISSNTSTIPLKDLTKGLPDEVKSHVAITHFFNPPRYMRLLELVTPEGFPAAARQRLTEVIDHRLGKTVVPCHDTPGFIANRLGTFWLHAAITLAIRHGIGVETADALLGKPVGIPKTGVFGLVDLVGLDLMPHILESLHKTLPESDAFHGLGEAPPLLDRMIRAGLTGRKGQGGFYRLTSTEKGEKKKEAIDLTTGSYRPAEKPKLAAVAAARKGGLKALLTHPGREGRYAWAVMSATLAYAAELVGPEKTGGIADDIHAIDTALRLGYNWKHGPFELIDKLGTAWFADKLVSEGKPVPAILKAAKGRQLYRITNGRREFLDLSGRYQPVPNAPGILLLADLKRTQTPLLKNISASVWDAGDGVAVFEFTSKMNALDPFILHLLNRSLRDLPARGFKALVIHNDGSNFSVGANLLMLQLTAALHLWPVIRWILGYGQTTLQNVKYAAIPVVAAPSGMALGGGAEIVLHSHAVVAHAESYIGLVEAGVGIVPGWGGCKELLGRAIAAVKGGPMPPVAHAFETIATAKVSKSAAEAKDLLFLREDDLIVMNPDRLLAAAKTKALEMARAYQVAPHKPAPHSYPLPGGTGAAALALALHDFALKGLATKHDVTVGTALARVLTGGDADLTAPPLTEEDMLRLEREGLVALTQTPGTRARISHMLAKGKPLRN